MANELVKYATEHGEVTLSNDTIKKYLVSGNGSVTEQEVTMFLNLCKYQKLNPFLREAYLIKFGNSPATIVTGKEVFTKRAAKNQNFDGYEAGITVLTKSGDMLKRTGTLVLKDETLIGGWARVYRKDWKVPLENEVSLTEYERKTADGKPMSSWKAMPATMIRKVALVQALRDAFPEDLQGLYSQEEMPVDDSKLDTKPVTIEAEIIESNIDDDISDLLAELELTEEQMKAVTEKADGDKVKLFTILKALKIKKEKANNA